MSGFLAGDVPCAKGAVCFCLDEFSKGPGARSRVIRLRDAIAGLAPTYEGLSEVFDQYLLSPVITDAEYRQRIVAHLKAFWFDDTSQRRFFPDRPVAHIFSEGLLVALGLSLKGRRVVPLNAWWVPDSTDLRLLTLADVKNDVTIGGRVTFLIMTPRPGTDDRATPPWILGDTAEAFDTEQQGDAVTTRRVKDLPA